ncbi:unnamed protein product [Closterium sp. NIES-64]|nr:unnamed protein product [Closterium sp. NIES-64]
MTSCVSSPPRGAPHPLTPHSFRDILFPFPPTPAELRPQAPLEAARRPLQNLAPLRGLRSKLAELVPRAKAEREHLRGGACDQARNHGHTWGGRGAESGWGSGGAAAQEGAREAERKVLRGRGHGVDGEAELQKGQDEGRLAERTGGAEGSGGDVGAREMRGEAERGESDLEEGLESGEEGAGSEGEKQGFQRRVCKGRGFKAHQGGGAWAAAAAADARIAAGQQGTAGVANDKEGTGKVLYHEKEGSSGVEKLKERSGKGRGEERSEGTRGGDDWGAGRRGDGGERGFGEHWRGEKGKGEEGQWEKGCWDGERGGGGGGNRWHTKGREGSEKGGSERRGEGKGCGSEESSAGLTAAEMVTLSEEDFGADEGLDGVIITRASHDYRMWQVEEDKSRAVDEGDRVRVPWGATEGSHGLPAGAKEDCGSGEELAAAGTRHILVVRAELCELEKAIEKITEMVMGSGVKVLVRRAVQVITGLHPSVRAVPVAAAEQIQGAGKEAEGDEREEAAEAERLSGGSERPGGEREGVRRGGGLVLSTIAAAAVGGLGIGVQVNGWRGVQTGCLEKDADERLVRAVACCLSVSRFEDASADVLASCYWSVPERRKTRVDGAAAARLLSRSLV